MSTPNPPRHIPVPTLDATTDKEALEAIGLALNDFGAPLGLPAGERVRWALDRCRSSERWANDLSGQCQQRWWAGLAVEEARRRLAREATDLARAALAEPGVVEPENGRQIARHVLEIASLPCPSPEWAGAESAGVVVTTKASQ